MLSRIIALGGVLCLLCVVTGAADWETDFAKAKAQAAAEHKFILLDFTGSDWCPWCKKLDQEVFSQPEFKAYAAKNLVCVLVDAPRGTQLPAELVQQNKKLNTRYHVRGPPTIVLLLPTGKEVARIRYQPGGAAKYVESLQTLLAPHKDKLTAVPAAKKTDSKVPATPPAVPAEDVHNAINNAL